MKFEEFN